MRHNRHGVQSLGQEDPLEKEVAPHSSILAWTMAWTEEPGRLQSIGSHRVRHDWSDLAHTHTKSLLEMQNLGSYPRPKESESTF